MKKIKNNALLITLNVILFIFFMWFIYFSYFTAKELLVLKYISKEDYSYKFYSRSVDECRDSLSYKIKESYEQELDWKYNSREQFADEYKDNCLKNLYKKAEWKKLADFKFNIIKYWLSSLFFFILFMAFSLQNLYIFNEKKKKIIKVKKFSKLKIKK